MIEAMPQTVKVRSELTSGYAVDMLSIGLIGAMHADLYPTEPGPFMSEGTDGAWFGPLKAATEATRKTGSAQKARNRP